MLFNSLEFAIFLPVIFAVYWLMPSKYRWICLLVSSYYFYMSWNAKYVFLILGTTIVSYIAARLIEKAESKTKKKIILASSVGVCLGVLFAFKYLNFAIESICGVFKLFSIPVHPIALNILLPVGISFYTFQTLSYVIDVYRGKDSAEKHFGYYATFISFFPQLVAGPIERTSNLLPQIKSKKIFDDEMALDGIKCMIWGYFKKMVIADMIGKYVDVVYSDLNKYSGFSLVIIVFFFTLQIYCDFSGYSNIAIGSAKLMGIKLMDNFKSPYFALSVREFWSRWHISLSTWFKDYVYIPLGGNRCSKTRNALNLMITFIVSGLWHGANWTFIIWGTIHGLAQVIEKKINKNIERLNNSAIGRVLRWAIVFVFCNIAWIFFRANSLHEAIYVIMHLFMGISSPVSYLHDGFAALGISKLRLCFICAMLLILSVVDWTNYRGDIIAQIKLKKKWVQWLVYVALALIVVLFAQKGEAAEFVYFQF